jgi:ubiquinone/menaquinone biosynthesis C-methylase UbiE
MKTNWDYSNLADAYLKRPEYSEEALNQMLAIAEVKQQARICDVGAGVAHLTIPLAKRGFKVDAVEPNDAMRANGTKRTSAMSNVSWFEGTGEETGMKDHTYSMVTFGSSFNVCDRAKALLETKRILQPNGWFACMWNHRDLNDPIQKEIENIIKKHIPEYDYGTRREDQVEVINKSGLFKDVKKITGQVEHSQTIKDVYEAWLSHATLERQAGDKFKSICDSIHEYLKSLNVESIKIPYTTNIWVAQLKN